MPKRSRQPSDKANLQSERSPKVAAPQETEPDDPDFDSDLDADLESGGLDPAFIDESGRPNKSKLKRHYADLQLMGEALVALPQPDLDAVPMPERLRDAVDLARRITKHGGLYRQKQYIGKLMRKLDAEPIRLALLIRQEAQRGAARQFQRVERWRSRLIDEPSAIDEFTALYPQSDRKQLVQLREQAQHERERGNAGAARELFGYVKEIIAEAEAGSHQAKPHQASAHVVQSMPEPK